MGPALACNFQGKQGSVSVNKFADIVALGRNLYEVDPTEIAEARVDMTILDGRIVFRR
jgi:predicted amidohydrolase YtcJ